MTKLSEHRRTRPLQSIDDLLARLRLEASVVADWHERPDWLDTKGDYEALLEFERDVLTRQRLFQRIDVR